MKADTICRAGGLGVSEKAHGRSELQLSRRHGVQGPSGLGLDCCGAHVSCWWPEPILDPLLK